MSVKTFDPKAVIVTFGGGIITGYAEGTILTIERVEDAFTESSGPDGEVTRVASNNLLSTAVLTLQQSSDSNAFLSGIHELDLRTGGGVVPFAAKEIGADTVVISGKSWIRKYANIEFGKEVTAREWTIVIAEPSSYVVGGNAASALLGL